MTIKERIPPKEGWGRPASSAKWHYFRDGMALCHKWGGLSTDRLELGDDESPDNCAACRKALASEKRKQ